MRVGCLVENHSQAAVSNSRRRIVGRPPRPLRLMTFLAPNLFWFYRYIGRYLTKRLRHPTELFVGSDYAQLQGRVDLAFVCGLPYAEHTRRALPSLDPLVAPVLQGERYGGKPVYFSDVIVRRESPLSSFADLRGRSWLQRAAVAVGLWHHPLCSGPEGGNKRLLQPGRRSRLS